MSFQGLPPIATTVDLTAQTHRLAAPLRNLLGRFRGSLYNRRKSGASTEVIDDTAPQR